MRFEPVFLDADRVPDGAISMTRLKHFDGCPRAGYLALQFDSVQTVRMLVGSAGHEIFERGTNLMIAQGEPMIPGDLMKTLVGEVLAEHPVPVSEHDRIREFSYRWAEQTTIDPEQACGVEQLVELEIGGWRLRCKLDYAETLEGGAAVRVDDYKTSPGGVPSYDDLGRRRPGGTAGVAAKQFQLVCYALAAAYGSPVRVERLAGAGEKVSLPITVAPGQTLRTTDRGTFMETVEPFPLAGAAQRFDLRLVYPGIENPEGQMVTRSVSLTPLELAEYRGSLEATLANLERSIETGDWPAQMSSESCGQCPARKLCPIPRELHDHAGEVNSVEDLREASEVLEQRQAADRALAAEIRAFLKGNGLQEVRYGRSRAWRFDYSESERIERKDEMWAAIDRAVKFGEPFDKSEFVKVVGSTRLKQVELTADDLAEPEEMP